MVSSTSSLTENVARGTSLERRLMQYAHRTGNSCESIVFSKEMQRPSSAKLWQMPQPPTVLPSMPSLPPRTVPLEEQETSYFATLPISSTYPGPYQFITPFHLSGEKKRPPCGSPFPQEKTISLSSWQLPKMPCGKLSWLLNFNEALRARVPAALFPFSTEPCIFFKTCIEVSNFFN